MRDLPGFKQFWEQGLRSFTDQEELRVLIELGDGSREVGVAVQKILPAIGPNARPVDVVGIPPIDK